ncbi:hypothetical protein PHLCEN_2v67 [Hermanssonia centrifuga]|uniref:F-box domain-containing protein n=1 Tax=Hermanssonia centrifuga TaxID=98765 RepID=A0A2R6S716_9APHY|nr:hypothetical protein PHLCEN_2v67 [Hermanssonia centrifuga]
MLISSLSLTPSRTVSGANIPEDLFERILDFLDEEIKPDTSLMWEEGRKRRELVGCSLTCRYWARRCQPRIFEHTRLQSEDDMCQLLSFLESPLSHLSDYIKHLYLIQHTSKSWILLLPLRLLSLSPTINLEIRGDWDETHIKRFGHLRSIHYMLPRAHPEFSSHISYLNLTYLRFRRFDDLAHLQSLATLLIRTLVHALGNNGDLEYTIEKVDDVYHIGCRWHSATSANFLFTPTTNSQTSEVHLEIITIDLSDSDRMEAAMKAAGVDWKKSDTLASRLPGLQKVVLGFWSRKNMSRFMNEVVDTQMENLREAGKLKYAIFDHRKTGWQWLRASPGLNKLEPTPFSKLKDLWRVYK